MRHAVLEHDNAKARELFDHAARLNNDYAQPRENLGKLAFEDGDYDEAERLFRSAIEIDPHYFPARYSLEVTYLRRAQLAVRDGHEEEARRLYQKAEDEARKLFEINASVPEPYGDLGVILTWRAEYASRSEGEKSELVGEAERMYRRCIALAPSSKECHGNLAHLLLATSRAADAAGEARACLAIDPSEAVCQADLASASAAAGVVEKATTSGP